MKHTHILQKYKKNHFNQFSNLRKKYSKDANQNIPLSLLSKIRRIDMVHSNMTLLKLFCTGAHVTKLTWAAEVQTSKVNWES